MCGICGFNNDDKALVKKMCDLIIHRGPDDEGYFTNSEVSIGMRRLSIIDLNTGHQPQHNENEEIWIVFNGEIYNFKELNHQLEKKGHKFYTKSDTETIIHAYEEWGEDCVKKLRGQFAFCIYDSIKHVLFIARDHMGLKPLYYYFDGLNFLFGSEIKCLFSHNIKRELDLNAFNLYLSLNYIPFNTTLFKGIYKLPASSYLIFDLKNRDLKIKKYWDIKFNISNTKPINVLIRELKDLIEDSVKFRLISDVPLGAFLSGGIDSSAIVAIMSKIMNEPVKTFSIGFEEGAPINETKYSRFVADYYNTNHTEIIVKSTCYDILPDLIWHLDDLISDPAIIPVHLMAKYAKEKMTVALTGDGADEVFAGYSVYYRTHKYPIFKYFPQRIYDFIMNFYNHIPSNFLRIALAYQYQSKTEEDRFLRTLFIVPDIEKRRVIPFKSEEIKPLIQQTFSKNLDIINQYIQWDLKYQLPNQYNMKVDKMSMAASFEARVPFLDTNIINWAATIPSELKLNNNIEKYILRLAMKDILPPKILKRKKLGFGTPVNLWFNTGLKEISGEILERLEKRTYLINSDYVKKLRQKRFKRIVENRVWNLIIFELWYETFIEKQRIATVEL